jgi:hypothetical protein
MPVETDGFSEMRRFICLSAIGIIPCEPAYAGARRDAASGSAR